MEYKKIEIGSHRGDYLVEIDGVKKILTYTDILELQAKEEVKKVADTQVIQEVKEVTFPDNDTEPIVEIPKKKKSRKKSEFR